MKKKLWVVLFVATLGVSVQAIWTKVSIEELVRNSDLIVIGELVSLESGISGFDNGTIEVQEVLLGSKEVSEVRLAVPAPRGPARSDIIPYKKGQQGVWFLHQQPGSDLYLADHPQRLQRVEDLAPVRQYLRNNPLHIRLVVDEMTAVAGAGVPVTVTISNAAGEPLGIEGLRRSEPKNLTDLSYGATGRWLIEGTYNRTEQLEVQLPDAVSQTLDQPVQLVPGGAFHLEDDLAQMTGMTRAGEYRIRLHYRGTRPRIEAQSNLLWIVLTPKE